MKEIYATLLRISRIFGSDVQLDCVIIVNAKTTQKINKRNKQMTRTLRLYNFLIDSGFYLLTIILLILLLKNFYEKEFLKWIMTAYYYIYYLTFEYLFGQTIGKMITKTKVISTDGSKASFWKILLRTFLRMIPIDCISYLISSNGMHDNLSNTELVKL
jgi:uncharacterized RDD family membrane protein YckC